MNILPINMAFRRIANTLIAPALFLVLSSSVFQQDVSIMIEWTPPVDTVSGYVLHIGNSSRQYTASNSVPIGTYTTITNLDASLTWYFAITSTNNSGQVSEYSSEVVYLPRVGIGSATTANVGTINKL